MDPNGGFPIGVEEVGQQPDSPSRIKIEPDTRLSPELNLETRDHASDSSYSDSENDEGLSQNEEEDEDEPFSLKRPAEDPLAPRPFKRHRGVLNTEYLDLLNRDIDDASHRVCLTDDAGPEASQLGLTFWSSLEKKLFFEALARLGIDDLPGISSIIGTKSVVEVNHYLHTLKSAHLMRQRERLRPALEFSEYPAAVELSPQCCHALDEAADAVSVRQERKEEQREENKWGEYWDISPMIARRFDKGTAILTEDQQKKIGFAPLFNLESWLRLSDRIFMNSSIPGENWRFIDDHPPSMWAATFGDFHALALSMARRLIQTTLFMSMSRIRAKKELKPGTRDVVRRKDVYAAVASLGMTANSHDFWVTCARRLRLEVYHDPPDREEDCEEEALTYEEIECELSKEEDPDVDLIPGVVKEEEEPSDDDLIDQIKEGDFEIPFTLSDEEESAINREANEVLQYSAADFPETYRTKQSLKNRIATERQQEQYAEECDQYAGYQAEAEMWEVLQKKPPMELPKVQEPGLLQRSKLDVESIYPIGRDWRSKMRYQNEWETTDESPGA